MNIGIFGGAFNPVHNGHLDLAYSYYDELKLDKLIFIPTAIPPHKANEYLVSGTDRINMLKLALKDTPFEISTIEFERKTKSYTFDTLNLLKKEYPNDTFFLIIGADQFLSFDKWYRYKDILEMATLCTCARESDAERQSIVEFSKKLGISDSFYLSSKKVIKVSSSEIRERIKNKQDISHLVLPSVQAYIKENKLYV